MQKPGEKRAVANFPDPATYFPMVLPALFGRPAETISGSILCIIFVLSSVVQPKTRQV
jgi:hypothetical protein